MARAKRARSRRAGLLALAVTAGCLDPNPDFDAAPSTASGTGGASASAETSASCDADGFEPNDVAAAPITIGSFLAILETAGAVDRYSVDLDSDAPKEIYAAADNDDVRVCTFIRCDGPLDPPDVTCMTGLSGSSSEGDIGCCGGPAIGLEYGCAGDMGAKVDLVVDQAPADCTEYGIEIATSPL